MLYLARTTGLAMLLSATALTAHAADSRVDSSDALNSGSAFIQVAETDVKKNGSLEDEKAAMAEKYNEWTNKLSEQAEETAEATDEAAEDASDVLDEAWNDVTEAWEAVQDATEENWEAAKEQYNEALAQFEETWDEMTSDS